MNDNLAYHRLGEKRIVKRFLYLPFESGGKWHWMKSVMMLQVLLPCVIVIGTEWCNLRIATVDDLIKY